jgi:hypothetical protein
LAIEFSSHPSRGAEFILHLPHIGDFDLSVYKVTGQRVWKLKGNGMASICSVPRAMSSGCKAGVYLAVLKQFDKVVGRKFVTVK